MIYRIEYHICALFVTLFILYDLFLKKDLRKNIDRSFMFLVFSHLIAIIFVIGTTLSNNNPEAYSLIFRDLVNHGFLITHNASAFIFALYTVYLLGLDRKRPATYFAIFSLPLFVTIFLLLTNPWKRWVFYYNQAGTYSHGSAIYILYASALFYLLYSVVTTVRLKKNLPKNKYYALFIFIAVSTVPVMLQMIFPGLNIEIFLQSLGILGVLLTIENKAEIYNTITEIYNRFAFFINAESALNNKIPFKMITIKLSDVDYYNSILGLEQMSLVAKEMAAWLTKLSPLVHAYDCDKGHFCLIKFSGSKVKNNQLLATIENRFKTGWRCNGTYVVFPTEVSVLNVPKEVDSIEQIMFLADMPYRSEHLQAGVVASDILSVYKREIQITQAILQALENRSLEVYYQPIWDSKDKKFSSAEALARIKHPKLGYISPGEFIPLAEKKGSIMEIGNSVFTEVCKFLQENSLEKLGLSFISVNLSLVQCMNQKLAGDFKKIMDRYNVDSAKIHLEITESATAKNPTAILNTMAELKKLGFNFILDDYGIGYSNISHILNLPFETIKVDKSILWGAATNKNAQIILESTLSMMKKMGFKVVIEGVETKIQKELLDQLQHDYLQGFLFAKPMNQKDFLDCCYSQAGGF